MNKLVFFWLFVAQGLLLGQTIQPTPSEIARVGVYAWDGLPSCGPNALISSVQAIKNLGSKMVRIYAGPFWDYTCGAPDTSPLDVKLRRGDYAWVLKSGFPTVWITAYPSADLDRYKYATGSQSDQLVRHSDRPDRLSARQAHGKGFNSAMGLAEHLGSGARVEDWAGTKEEARRAGVVAACSVPEGTTVFFSNWEARHDVPDPQLWPNYAAYLQAGINGFNQAKLDALAAGCRGQIRVAFEGIDPPTYPMPGMVSDFVGIGARLTGLDALSYSSWRTLDTPTEFLGMSVRRAVTDILSSAAEHGLPEHLFLGEFGNPRTIHPDAAERMAIVITMALQAGAEGLMYWNLYDLPKEVDEYGRYVGCYGVFDEDGQITSFGRTLEGWFRTMSTQPVIRPVR